MAGKLDVEMVEVLLNAGADPEALDEDRRTALERLPSREESDRTDWDRAMNLLGSGRPNGWGGVLGACFLRKGQDDRVY